jgi:hypothetical protein
LNECASDVWYLVLDDRVRRLEGLAWYGAGLELES